ISSRRHLRRPRVTISLRFHDAVCFRISVRYTEAPVDDLPEKPDKKAKPRKSKKQSSDAGSGFSRRDFLKISGVSAAAPLVAKAGVLVAEAEADGTSIQGPGKVPVTLNVNGKTLNAQLEPRVTLLDALRDQFELTGSKRVCDRGTCGACTVL